MHILAALTVASVLTTGYAQSPPGYMPATSQHLSVKYGSVDVTPAGMRLLGSQVTDAPELAYNGTDGATYLAIMIDPDVQLPQSSSKATLVHWLLPGLKPSPKGGLASDQNALAPYVGPSPPPGQTHQYLLFLYSQPASFSVPANYVAYFKNITASVYNRVPFDVANFTTEAGLGEALAANWFLLGTPAAASSSVSASASASGSATASPNATTVPVSTAASIGSMSSVLVAVAALGVAFQLL